MAPVCIKQRSVSLHGDTRDIKVAAVSFIQMSGMIFSFAMDDNEDSIITNKYFRAPCHKKKKHVPFTFLHFV